jgi:signal transduction histidine kinase/CheY-like chemotaxis protein
MSTNAPASSVSQTDAEQDSLMASAILRERIELLHDQLPFLLISSVGASCALVAMLWTDGVRPDLLLGWLAGAALLTVVRWLLLQRYQQQPRDARDPVYWSRLYLLMAAISGGMLCLAGLLFFQTHLLTLFAISLIIGGSSIVSIMLHAAYLPAHRAFVLLALLPFTLLCLQQSEPIYVALGIIGLIFLPLNLLLARKMQNNLLESIRLRLRNQALIEALTRQKEVAEAAQLRAEQANVAKTRFFAAASHDLRQPVQALELFAATLEQQLAHHPSRALVANIRAVGREFGDLLNTLLDFSKIDAAAIQPARRDFPITDLLQRLADDFKPQATARGLQCRVVMSSAWVHSDPVLLERILRNLMSNAIKYTPSGKVLLGCRRVGGNSLRIEVHDTGVGIAPGQQHTIFKEFTQVDGGSGLGLGLAIVDGLARLLQHPLSVRSQLQRGSMFAVTVPLGLPGLPARQTAPAAQDRRLAASILLVDDDQSIRLSAAHLLESWGFAVVTAESAEEALEMLRSTGFQPDVILADYRLREGRTGVEAIRAMRTYCGREVPAAILTGDTEPELLRDLKASGFALLYKPVAAAKLRTLIGNLMRT